MSYRAYQKSQNSAESPRSMEYRAFALATGRLTEAANQNDYVKFYEALQFNRELWTILQADLADPNNQLPEALKASLLSLSLWVQRHTSLVMRGEASPDSLIEVNRQIMDGLKMEPATAQP